MTSLTNTNGINSVTTIRLLADSRNVTDTLNQVNGRLTSFYQSQPSSPSINGLSTASSRLPKQKSRMFQIRRTFLLIVTFDLIFMGLLWIIYNQILNINIADAFRIEVINYTIKTSLFDIVGLSAVRFILLMLPYALFKLSHWIFVAFTTLGSTGFIIAKTCVFTISKAETASTDYIILIVSFILAWVEIWFFDYRVLPHERRLREAASQSERRPLLSATTSNETHSSSPVISNHQSIAISNEPHQSFYSPINSADGSDTEQEQEPVRRIRSDSNLSQSVLVTPSSILDDEMNDDYERQANEIIDEVWKIFHDNDSWTIEAQSKNNLDVVRTKTYPQGGKVFRLSGVMKGSRSDLLEILFERQEDFPKWSSTVHECQVLKIINNDLFITYQITNEQAQGIISKRDFVNLTTRRFIDDVVILAAQACLCSQMPEKDNCVRAQNKVAGYIIEKLDETTCKLTWILNVDLKGWIPQYLINATLANVQLGIFDSLRNHLSKTINRTASFSSSMNDTTP